MPLAWHDGRVTRRAAPDASPLGRLSVVRLVVAGVIMLLLVLAFTNLLGPLRGLFRAIVVTGALVIVLSYPVGWWLRRRRASAVRG